MLPKFWAALASLHGWATDGHDWRRRLGDEWPLVQLLLRGTGKVAHAVECPSPGGDGCPRTVVRLPTGALRGVCGSRPAFCDSIELEPHDVLILEINKRKLCEILANALCTTPRTDLDTRGRLIAVGVYAVAAGVSADVHIVAVDRRDPLSDEDLHGAGIGDAATILLLPDEAIIPGRLRARLIDRGHLLVALHSVVVARGAGELGVAQSPRTLFDPIHRALTARLKALSAPSGLSLPDGVRWPQVTLSLLEEQTLMIAAGRHAHRLDPGQLGMRSGKNGHPTSAWTFVTRLIEAGGFLSPYDSERTKKQKQEASERLRRVCGIDDDPMPWDRARAGYAAAFICRDERGGASARSATKFRS